MNSPTVSIIIPTYNRKAQLMRAIDSVLNQSYRDFELLIIDDGSTDDTEIAVNQIKDERIIYIKQDNSGACVARNRGIEEARGEYIAFHDSDDIMRPNRIEQQLHAARNANANVTFCKLLVHRSDGSQTTTCADAKQGYLSSPQNVFGIGTETLLAKRKVFEQIRFDPEMPRFQDYEVLLRITQHYRLYHVNMILSDVYESSDSITSNAAAACSACKLMLEKDGIALKQNPISRRNLSSFIVYESTNQDLAIRNETYRIAWRFNPSIFTAIRILRSRLRSRFSETNR